MRWPWTPKHKHSWVESYSGRWADEPGGPRTVHLIHWDCACGEHLGDKPDHTFYEYGETRK